MPWAVRTFWESYVGWFRLQSTTELYPVDPRAAIRQALANPIDFEPLHALLKPGMKLTIAVDDISLPGMVRRQRNSP